MGFESHIVTDDKDKMINMLLNGNTIKSIADEIGVSRQTIYSWKAQEEVKAELERRRAALKKTAQDKITSKVSDCIDNMYDMASQKTDQRVRFQANKFIIEMALGKATANTGESKPDNTGDDKDKPKNELQSELDNIKEMKAV